MAGSTTDSLPRQGIKMNWIMEKLGLTDAYKKIVALEARIETMERDIDGLKMEADIMYSKSLGR